MDKEKIAICALNRIFGFEPRIGHSLLEYTGSATSIFDMDRDSLRAILGPYAKYLGQICPKTLEEAEDELEDCEDEGASFLGVNEGGYPAMLRECEDAPIGLYLRAESSPEEIFSARPAIAIVGTRDMSQYGQSWCRDLLECISGAKIKPLIVSGLAFGIDITAHEAALRYGIPTVAVMATGIDSIYPSRHTGTADRMASTPGCALVTDYPRGTSPLPLHFLRRNRIIAGLSDSIILVESRVKGGGMMTARLGSSYNRDVYALPGRVDDIRSQGCNHLIREKLAEPVADLEDFVRMLGLEEGKTIRKKCTRDIILQCFSDMDPAEIEKLVSLTEIIRSSRGITAEEIALKTGWKSHEVSGLTGILAAEGIICMDLLGHCSFN